MVLNILCLTELEPVRPINSCSHCPSHQTYRGTIIPAVDRICVGVSPGEVSLSPTENSEKVHGYCL